MRRRPAPFRLQSEAVKILNKMLGRDENTPLMIPCTGDTDTCKVDECMVCGIRDCPDSEPLHYHHDGCPSCFQHHVGFGE